MIGVIGMRFDLDWKKIDKSHKTGFFLGAVLGAISFVSLWGWRPLNPYDLWWALQPWGTDFCFSTIGSLEFLKERWTVPFGLIKGLVYPSDTSIVYADSIPILALFSKLLYPLFGGNIQYFGLWGLVCSVLQGGVSALIVQRYSRSAAISATASLFFIFCPFFLGKMFAHVSMTGQWLLLTSLLLALSYQSKRIQRYEVLVWPLILSMSLGIFAYFTPMILLLMALYFWLRARSSHFNVVLKRFAASLVLSFLSCAWIFWLIGGILPKTVPVGPDYGTYSLDLNGLFNPTWASRLIKGSPAGIGSWESYSWLGLGIVIGGIYLSIHALLFGTRPLTVFIKRWAPFVIVGAIFFAVAVTNRVALNGKLLFDIPISNAAVTVLNTFRTSGRFVWVVWDMIVIAVIGGLVSLPISKPKKGLIIVVLLSIQLVDGSNWTAVLKDTNPGSGNPPLRSEFWKKLDPTTRHLSIVPFSGTISHSAWAYISFEAVEQGRTINSFWLGRYPFGAIQENDNRKIEQLKAGHINDDDLVIVNSLPAIVGVETTGNIFSYLVDNQLILGKGGLSKPGSGVVPVIIKQSSLEAYLQHLREIAPHSVIVATGREQSLPAALDPPTEQAFNRLGIGKNLSGAHGFAYLAVIDRSRLVSEKFAPQQVDLSIAEHEVKGADTFPTALDISLSTDFSVYPAVRLAGVDVSRSFLGINFAVYDLQQNKVVEVGCFDLFSMKQGIYLEMNSGRDS